MAKNFATSLPPSSGLFCRMFYKVSGSGTLSFRTAVHSTAGGVGMWRSDYTSAQINWPAEGEVGSFEVIPTPNKYLLDPVDLKVGCGDSIVQVNININTIDTVQSFIVPLLPEGTCSPKLDTILTGGLGDPNPPAFDPPSLVSGFTQRLVNPFGPPNDPLLFVAVSFNVPLPPSTGLWCRMFYKVTGTGTLTFRTETNAMGDFPCMTTPGGSSAPVNWPVRGEVGSFEVIEIQRGDATGDGQVNISDAVYLISYLFKVGPAPNPFLAADANCDGSVTTSDVVYLINYLFKGGPAPGC